MPTNERLRVSYHEAGHAVGYLLLAGVPVAEMKLTAEGGACAPALEVSPEERIIVALAGAEAEALMPGGRRGLPSAGQSVHGIGDIDMAEAAMRDMQRCFSTREWQAYRKQAEDLVYRYGDAVRFLAGQLEQTGYLDREDLARLCWQPGSPLSEARHLYRQAVQPPALQVRPRRYPDEPAAPIAGYLIVHKDGRKEKLTRAEFVKRFPHSVSGDGATSAPWASRQPSPVFESRRTRS